MARNFQLMNAIRKISKLRFNAIAGYIRKLSSYAISEELKWYEDANSRVLGVLLLDLIDGDFGGIVLGRDVDRKFRAVDVTNFSHDPAIAEATLLAALEEWSRRPDEAFEQGDETIEPVDFFTPIVTADKLNDAFARVAGAEHFSPARALIEEMMHHYEDVDGNFVEQFQSSAFDARFWELYLFALLTEQQFVFDRSYVAPDFLCEGLIQDIFVEAVTVNPARRGNLIIEPAVPDAGGKLTDYLREYMPIKWAGALTAKLSKEYWNLPHVQDRPIVFAVQDFHAPRAMTFTGSTIVSYLYGRAFTALYDHQGRLVVKSYPIQEHQWGTKVVHSGFFNLPNAERISAVIQNPTATISKFNRMARLAGLGSLDVRMLRFGTAYRADKNAALPLVYKQLVGEPGYAETWCEGLNVYHNPTALHPLDPKLFPEAMHFTLRGENVIHTVPDFHPYSAETVMLVPRRDKDPQLARNREPRGALPRVAPSRL